MGCDRGPDMSYEWKDYLTVKEAASYAGVSYSQFRKLAPRMGLLPISFMGRLLYRKADLRRVIEEGAAWQHTTSITGRGTSSGDRTGKGTKNG